MVERDLHEKRLSDFYEQTQCEAVKYNVEVVCITSPAIGEDCLMETWTDEEGKCHRDFGPAHVQISVRTGEAFVQEWYHHGQRHRDDGPAILVVDPNTGEVLDKRYYSGGDQIFPQVESTNKFVP